MHIILAHCYTKSGPHIEVAKRDNGGAPLYATHEAAQEQADRWNRSLKMTGLLCNRFYHAYDIRSTPAYNLPDVYKVWHEGVLRIRDKIIERGKAW